jgi:hypothetical protein
VAYVTPAAAGIVRLTGAPSDFNSRAYMGVQGCPASGVFKVGCPGGTEAYEGISPGMPYSIDLTPGSWKIGAYYRVRTTQQPFIGRAVAITSVAGHTVQRTLWIAFQGY